MRSTFNLEGATIMKAHSPHFGFLCLLMLAIAPLVPNLAHAHCDGLDGPVVEAARKALASNSIDPVLIWVQEGDEAIIREAFEQTLKVRALNDEAKDLADRFFFETLVRVHRAGEGAPFTGLKPAGRDLGPAIPLADEALADGDADALVELLTHTLHEGLSRRFEHARETRDFASDDIEAGREHVEAYVIFIHYVERAYEAASHPVMGHFPESDGTAEPHDD